jgi:hypothetical protein
MKKTLLIDTAALFLATGTAQATENDTTLTLACQGTITSFVLEDAKPEPISMGIIVNLTKKTVHGFDDPVPVFGIKEEPAKITGVTETYIAFGGDNGSSTTFNVFTGRIDRVTGDVWAEFSSNFRTTTTYELKCKPAQKMF